MEINYAKRKIAYNKFWVLLPNLSQQLLEFGINNSILYISADYCIFVDSRLVDHRDQCVLSKHRLRGLVNSQQLTKSWKCVYWDHSISANGNLYPRSHIPDF